MTSQELNQQIIAALDIAHLSENDRQKVIETATIAIYQAVVGEAVERLTDDQSTVFEKMLDENPTPEAVLEFFGKNIPDFETLVASEVTKFIQEGSDIMAGIK